MSNLLESLKFGIVFTPNVDHVVNLQFNKHFYDAYKSADYILCDSKILHIASYLLRKPIVEKISGSDFLPAFCEFHKDDLDVTIFLLGSKPGIAKKAMNILNSSIGRRIVVDCYSPSFSFEKNKKETKLLLNRIEKSKATILAVGVSSPKQEIWISENYKLLNSVRIIMGVGATIDFMSGTKKRAPKYLSKIGLEWAHRLIQEPRRLWRRYLINDLFFLRLIFMELFGAYQDPFN